jgi:hypothetical protein
MQPPDLLRPFIEPLEKLRLPYMITGSTAGIVYGEPRMTHDVDIVVALAPKDVAAFVAAFPLDEFYCPPDDVLTIEVRRGQRGHCNLIHHATGFKADVYVAFDELHRWALARRRTVDLDGFAVALAPIEYVIVRKLEYYAEGRSEKHLRDIRGMLSTSRELIDHGQLARFVAERKLDAIWELVASSDAG